MKGLITSKSQIPEGMSWEDISCKLGLSEEFIHRHSDLVDWEWISQCQKLSEEFIHQHADLVDWYEISVNQKLSEGFIHRHADLVYWYLISKYQKLSEEFIHKHADLVGWYLISKYQKLSEEFIHQHADLVDWYEISVNQKLSEEFIKTHIDLIELSVIGLYQYLSKDFRSQYHIQVGGTWVYLDAKSKKKQVKDCGLYECYDDYFIAYKGIRSDNYSKFNFQYQYFAGETYHGHADYTNKENSFGLFACTKEEAINYWDEKIIKVKIHYKDIARLVHKGSKIRCTAFTVLEEIA